MNKIEEILNRKIILQPSHIKDDVIEAIKQFGRLAFEAGKKRTNHFIDDYCAINKYKYETYEDFLKEIENERD